MGAKYTTLATSGYNGSPPSDAGAQAAENLISWSGIKTKLGDPVKTLADAINTALVSAFDYSVRQITTNDTTVAGDHMRCVEVRNDVSTAITISLADAATMTNLYRVFIKNSSARNQTLTRITGGDTLDGVAGSVVLAPGEGRVVQTIAAATGYVTVSRFGPVTDGDAIVAGGTDGTKKVRLEVDGLTTATTRVVTVPDRDLTLNDLAPITNSIGSDVVLNNVGLFFTGPTVAQGTSGTWFASGTVTVLDTSVAARFTAKLWDGTTVIDSAVSDTSVATGAISLSLSGYIVNPAGNIRISVNDGTSVNGLIKFNLGGLSKDSTLSAIRIA